MTTEQLVKDFVKALSDGDREVSEVLKEFERFYPRVLVDDEDVTIWSIALNDLSRDIRFVKMDGGMGTVNEVSPVTVMRTEYRDVV